MKVVEVVARGYLVFSDVSAHRGTDSNGSSDVSDGVCGFRGSRRCRSCLGLGVFINTYKLSWDVRVSHYFGKRVSIRVVILSIHSFV